MDAYHHHHRFPRPPAPADPYHQQPPPPPVTHHHHHHWQPPGHFQYSPSPPPQQQWGPQPPPPGSYPPTMPQHHSYPPPPPPRQHRPPQPPSRYPPPPPSQPYAQPNQDWGAQNWGHHHQPQGWDYQAQSYEEDWAAKARAWADANKATENQHQQLQFIPADRADEQSHYHEEYPNSKDPRYTDAQHQPVPASSYQQVPAAPLHRPPVNLPLVSFDLSSYAPEGHLHAIKDGASASDSSAMIHHQGNLPSPSVHQQEVPSSYSSATAITVGNDGGMLPMSNSAPQDGQHHVQPAPIMPLADQPLEFAPRFTHDNPRTQSSYSYLDPVGPTREMDSVANLPSMNSWTDLAHYSTVLPPGPQPHDPALVVAPGPPFGSFPGSSLQPTIPSGGPPFALSGVNALQHNTVFSGDAYGIPSLSERPKKASVPNWLKEEIKKAVIPTPSLDHPKEESHSVEDEVIDRSFGRGDQDDSKTSDSSRSAEEDEDDEDSEEAARAAAINQEIKRVLTEVLLKVTDELFDEIATKVLNEDNPKGEVDKTLVTPNHKPSMSTSVLSTPRADTKLLTPGNSRESVTEGIADKSGSILPGDVLGLADYATDDDDDNEDDDVLKHSTSADKHHVDANGSSLVQPAGISGNKSYLERDPSKGSSIESKHMSAGGHAQEDTKSGSKVIVGVVRSKLLEEVDLARKTSKDDNKVKETKPDKNDPHESKKVSGKKEEETVKIRTDEKNNGAHQRYDERHARREKTDDPNRSKEGGKEHNGKSLEKAHESESKKRPLVDDKEDKERERNHKGSAKEESSRKREHAKDKEDERSRHKRLSDSSRNKKRRSSSITRVRSSKDHTGHRDNDSSDDASNYSTRKRTHSRRRSLSPSPSPVKSRRRGRRSRSWSRSRSRSPVRRHR